MNEELITIANKRKNILQYIEKIDLIISDLVQPISEKAIGVILFRTGSTARGDFAINSEGVLVSDVEYLVIAPKKYWGIKDVITRKVNKFLEDNDVVSRKLIEVTFSQPLGALIRRKAFFFFDAYNEGVWLIGKNKKTIFGVNNLSVHFVNFTLLVRLNELSSIRRYQISKNEKIDWQVCYKLAKIIRHLITSAYYNKSSIYASPVSRLKCLVESAEENGDLIEKIYLWSVEVYEGNASAMKAFCDIYDQVVRFVTTYISTLTPTDKWRIGRSSYHERLKDNISVFGFKIECFIDTSKIYRELVLEYLDVINGRNPDSIEALNKKYSFVVKEL